MTLLYPYKSTRSDEELRYSLRSVARNFPHDNVMIVGDKPEWLINVDYLKTEPYPNKHIDQRAKLLLALLSPNLSSDFVWMNDDFFVMRKIGSLPVLNRGSVQAVIREVAHYGHSVGDYHDGMVMAEKLLQDRKGIMRPVSFELHIPMEFNKFRMLAILEEFDDMFDHTNSVQFRTLYGNIVYGDMGEMRDVKVRSGDRGWPRGTSFLSTDNNSFANGNVGQYIKDTFTEKCKYER